MVDSTYSEHFSLLSVEVKNLKMIFMSVKRQDNIQRDFYLLGAEEHLHLEVMFNIFLKQLKFECDLWQRRIPTLTTLEYSLCPVSAAVSEG